MTEKAKELGIESIFPQEVGVEYIDGLTKREYFAAMAIQVMSRFVETIDDYNYKDVARKCVFLADALLDELSYN